jgi:hypothetical protein
MPNTSTTFNPAGLNVTAVAAAAAAAAAAAVLCCGCVHYGMAQMTEAKAETIPVWHCVKCGGV